MGEFINVAITQGVATLTLTRPPMNVLNFAVQTELAGICTELAKNSEVRVVVFTGGDEVFAAGADVNEFVDLTEADMASHVQRLQANLSALSNLPQPTIAAVSGYALGGGCEAALACDLRIASSTAVFGLPEVLLGIMPGAGGTARLTHLVGPARAKEIMWTGRFVKADEALAIGLVSLVVEPEELLAAAHKLATTLAKRPALSIQAIKRVVDLAVDVSLDEALSVEASEFTRLFGTDDKTIGMKSFLENGPGKANFEHS
jgi:enoyl-CoA hydratase